MGSIENGLVENVVDEDGGKCNFARVITGCWKEWHPGMKLQRCDIFNVGKNVYTVFPMPLGTNEYVSMTAPTHKHGVWKSPEGINFLFLQDDGETRADIRNVTFRNIRMDCKRSIACYWENCEWARLVHPEIPPKDYPVIDIRVENVVKTVPGAIVGEEWEIRILKVQKSCAYARGERLLVPSPARVDPGCPCYGKCGGCDCRHMSYEEELRFKLDKVNDALERIGKQSVRAETIVGSDETEAYRNKGILAVGTADGRPVSGFYRERSHQIIPVERCLIQDELTHRAAAALTAFMAENGIPAYDEESGSGVVRHLYCRRAYHSADRLLCVVARRGFGERTHALVDTLRAACPELTGIVLNVNKSAGNTVLAGDFYTLWGKGHITDTLCGFVFDIAPQAFFQVNPPQAERLYDKALAYAALSPDELAFDLYCGAGTISLCLARRAGRVIGAEIVPEAVENARANAAANGVENAEFICADAGEAAQTLAARGLRPKVVVVDPPRKGMREDAVRAVCSMAPERVVYVSCEPSTLARDVLRFSALGYTLREATAFDLFPRTKHVESVVKLTRAGS
jgi:23S rRNA (uracil1939-C5)-methyltransferase